MQWERRADGDGDCKKVTIASLKVGKLLLQEDNIQINLKQRTDLLKTSLMKEKNFSF